MSVNNEKRLGSVLRWIVITIAVIACVVCEAAIGIIHQFISNEVLPTTFNYYANALCIADILCATLTIGYIIYYLWCKVKEDSV